MNDDRDERLDRQLGAMRAALLAIADYGDCDYSMEPEATRQRPCPCPRCTARRALDTETEWRYQGARFDRTQTMPRERAIMDAWKRYASGVTGGSGNPDYRLAQILGDAEDRGPSHSNSVYTPPSVRDWFVASSVVQWLATNVGSTLLTEAGFRWDPPKIKSE